MVTFFLTQIEDQRYYGSMINLMGKQRFFAQRIIYLADNIVYYEKDNKHAFYEDRLRETLYEFHVAHQNIRDEVFSFDHNSSLYILYLGESNLNYEIEYFIDLGYQFLGFNSLAEREALLRRMWIKWGGDMYLDQETDNEHPYILKISKNNLTSQSHLSGLLEAATFNMQLLGESHLQKIKQFALWALLAAVIVLIANAYFVVIPLLVQMNNISKD